MDTALRRAPDGASPCPRPRLKQIERQLERFPRRCRAVVRAQAARHPAFADLALSFPALLFVIATRSRGIDVETLAGAAIRGTPLKHLAIGARLPFWSRKLPPEAFDGPIGELPAGDIVALRIANHLPLKPKLAALWLKRVAFANRYGHEAFALWVARHHVELGRIERGSRRQNQRDALWQRLCLWAWYSMADGTEGHRLIDRRWTPGIGAEAANLASSQWKSNIDLHLYLAGAETNDLWFVPGEVDGYAFVALATGEDIREEAAAMSNCLRNYGGDVRYDHSRLWSVRKDGKRIATLSIGLGDGDRLLGITQMRARANGTVPRQVAIAARKWCNSQNVFNLDPQPKAWETDMKDRRRRQALWRPYWIAKRTIPAWLPLTPGGGLF